MLSSRDDPRFEILSSFQQFFLRTDGPSNQQFDLCEKEQRSAALLQDPSANQMKHALLQLMFEHKREMVSGMDKHCVRIM
jgi:hypothetical protein